MTTGVGLPDAVHSIETFPVSFALRGLITNLSNVAGTTNVSVTITESRIVDYSKSNLRANFFHHFIHIQM